MNRRPAGAGEEPPSVVAARQLAEEARRPGTPGPGARRRGLPRAEARTLPGPTSTTAGPWNADRPDPAARHTQ